MGCHICLRFFCPAIVAPDSVDLELPCQGVQIQSKLRRGLVIIAKILQNLSNNMAFGKEAHMVFLNPLLETNIGPMSKFLEEPFVSTLTLSYAMY
jgi:GTPase-activator protein for Ras-like GTPase